MSDNEKRQKTTNSPTVRLALGQGQAEREGNTTLIGPNVRLALGADVCKTVGPKALGPVVRLAVSPISESQGANSVEHHTNEAGLGEERLTRPALLVSYYYLEGFLKHKHRYFYRDWVMDSGAFSAHNSGVDINLQDYIDCCKQLMEEDPTLTEIFSLDVIGDWKAGVKNLEKMWKQGVPAIPCFHYGEPWDLLKGFAKDYPKVAIGGCVGRRDKDKFASQCFSRVWPKKLHGFGFGSERSLMLLPWHSVDATNWELGPCKYGSWKAFGQRVSVRGSKQNLRAEVEWYLELERRARERWKKEMSLLLESDAPSIRFALNGQGQGEVNGALGPTVRLAHKESGREHGKGLRQSNKKGKRR